MRNIIESNTGNMQFGIHNDKTDEFLPIENKDDVKKYSKKFGLNEKMLQIITDMYDDFQYNVNEDLKDIWRRLNKTLKKETK